MDEERQAPVATRRTFLNLLPALVAAGVAAPRAAHAAAPPATGEVPIGQALRDAPLQGLNGRSRRLAEFLGRPLIINVWASWCGPCRQEMKSLERLAWRDHAVPFTIIGISTDDYPEPPRRLLAETHATISHFIDQQLLWEHMLGASTLPLTVLVDARGRVVDKVRGAREWDDPEALALIARAFPAPARAAASR
jgi:thiol-disulfide isomerase/thioredoxin